MDPSGPNFQDDQPVASGLSNPLQESPEFQSFGQSWDIVVPPAEATYDSAGFQNYQNNLGPAGLTPDNWNGYNPQDGSNVQSYGYYSNAQSLNGAQVGYEYDPYRTSAFVDPASSGQQNNGFTQFSAGGDQGQTISPYQLQSAQASSVSEKALSNNVMPEETLNPKVFQQPSVETSDPLAKFQQLPSSQSTNQVFTSRNAQILVANSSFKAVVPAPFAFLGTTNIEVDAKKGTIPAWKKRASVKDIRAHLLSGKGGKEVSLKDGPISKKLKLSIDKGSSSKKLSEIKKKRQSPTRPEVAESISSSEESDDSDDEDADSTPSSPEEMNFEDVFPGPRPDSSEEAIKYDTARALWRTSKRHPTPEEISNSLQTFGTFMTGLRQKTTDLQKEMKRAEESSSDAAKASNTAKVRAKLEISRRHVDAAIFSAVHHGHHEVLEYLGVANMVLVQLREHLVVRLGEGQQNGDSAKLTLELWSKALNISEQKLADLKWSKLSSKYRKSGDPQVVKLLDKIEANAKAFTAKEADKAKKLKEEGNSASKAKALPAPRVSAAAVTSLKRPRDNDTTKDIPNKKSTSSTASSPIPVRKTSDPQNSSKISGPTTQASKPKVTAPLKPLSYFGNLQSARKISKVDGKSPAVKPLMNGAQTSTRSNSLNSRPDEKKSDPAPAPKPPAFSFSQAMMSITQPKEEVSASSPTPSGPPETAEEKKKRLRKEERRKLRVKFRDDANLVEIRYFTHQVGEEVSSGDQAAMDVRNAASEGQALKRHLDADDEDDEILDPEEDLAEWKPLEAFDLGEVDPEAMAHNYLRTGGPKEPESPELVKQKDMESKTLMVIFTRTADIPPSPQEPPPFHSEQMQEESLPFGEPSDEIRRREAAYRQRVQPPVNNSTPSISAILSTLNQFRSQQQPQQPVQPAAAGLEFLKNFVSQNGNTAQPQYPAQAVPPMGQANANFDSTSLNALLAKLGSGQPAQGQSQGQANMGWPAQNGVGGQQEQYNSSSQSYANDSRQEQSNGRNSNYGNRGNYSNEVTIPRNHPVLITYTDVWP